VWLPARAVQSGCRSWLSVLSGNVKLLRLTLRNNFSRFLNAMFFGATVANAEHWRATTTCVTLRTCSSDPPQRQVPIVHFVAGLFCVSVP